jgi:predicted aminopeptidase
MKRYVLLAAGLAASITLLSSCSPFYVMRAAYEQSRILWRRQPIETAISSSDISADERRKLQLVLDARTFAKEMGLTPRKSFTRFSRVDRDVLVWVLVASRADSFSLRTWWFPVVGSVPYKGYFDRSDAEDAGRSLSGQGYEVSIRGAEAFSTLGWFNDPVLSTTLRHPDARIANTVIHEITHATVWIGSQVDFNESLANFVGTEGAAEFFAAEAAKCAGRAECGAGAAQNLASAQHEVGAEYKLAGVITRLYAALDELYRSNVTTEEKLSRRGKIFEELAGPARSEFPSLKVLQVLNNAEIIQFKLYMTGFEDFSALYECRGRAWGPMIEDMRAVSKEIKHHGGDAFALLKDKIAECRSGRTLPPNPAAG